MISIAGSGYPHFLSNLNPEHLRLKSLDSASDRQTERKREREIERGERGMEEEIRAVVPERVLEAVHRTRENIEDLRPRFLELLSLSTPEVLAELLPLQRAECLLLLARATSALFTCRLRCTGIYPDDHNVKSELERLRLFQEKLERFIDLSKAPLRPSTTLNYQAATRFIKHSLPDLTPEQQKGLRDISQEQGMKINNLDSNARKKRKYQPGKKSVQSAAMDFLEKAKRELIGDTQSGFREPLQPEISDGEELPMS